MFKFFPNKFKRHEGKHFTKIETGKKRKKKSPYGKPSFLLILKKTILSYDVGNYNYSFRKTQRRVTKTAGYG